MFAQKMLLEKRAGIYGFIAINNSDIINMTVMEFAKFGLGVLYMVRLVFVTVCFVAANGT